MLSATAFGEPTGQGWAQIAELAIAFALSLAIGVEREAKQKSAGMRTYSLVGGGLIFVRRDAVRGLTTAASIWLVAAVGAASGPACPSWPWQ